MRRALAVAVAAVVALASPAAAVASVSVTVDRVGVATGLGKRFAIRSTVVNTGPGEARGLVAHLNIASLRPGVYGLTVTASDAHGPGRSREVMLTVMR